MSWHWVLIALLAGFALGYMVCDRLTTESKITYVIKKLRAKNGGTVSVDSEATIDKKADRIAKRNKRKEKRDIKDLDLQ